MFSCRFPSLPTHCFLVQQESVKLDIGELQQFPDLERHRLIKPENTIRLHTDKRINISFSANSIQENGDIIFMVSWDSFLKFWIGARFYIYCHVRVRIVNFRGKGLNFFKFFEEMGVFIWIFLDLFLFSTYNHNIADVL